MRRFLYVEFITERTVRTMTFSSLYAGISTATRGSYSPISGVLRRRRRSIKAKIPTRIRRALISTSPTKKTVTAKLRRNGRHDFSCGLAHQLRDRNEFVTLSAQRSDEQRQRRNSNRAVTTAVVQQNNAAAKIRPVFHGGQGIKDGIDDLLWGLARVLVPVVGVDFVADDDIAHLLDAIGRSSLLVRVRLLIDGVWGTKIQRFPPQLSGKETLRS